MRLLVGFCVVLTCPHPFGNTSLCSGTTSCARLIWYFSSPGSGMNHFSKIPSERAMAPHSGTLAWKIPWTGKPGGLQSTGRKESDATEWLLFHFSLSCIGEGNGNPLWCSCLENPRDAVAWWAAVYGVTQSRIRLKRLSSSSSQNTLDWGMVFGNQDPGPRGCSWLCGDSSLMPCQWTQLGCMYLFHVCLFTYVCSHLYLLSIHPSIYSSS